LCGHRPREQVNNRIHLRCGQSTDVPVSAREKLAERVLLECDAVQHARGSLTHGPLFGPNRGSKAVQLFLGQESFGFRKVRLFSGRDWTAAQNVPASLGKTFLSHGQFLKPPDRLGKFLAPLLFLGALPIDHRFQLAEPSRGHGDPTSGLDMARPQ